MIQEKHRFRLFPEVAMAAEADQVAGVAAVPVAVAAQAVEALQAEAEAPAGRRWF